MKASKFTEAQIAFVLKQAEDGTPVAEVCRKAGISDATFYNWRKKYAGLMPSEMKRLRQLEEVVQICRLMWTEEHPTFAGRYFQIEDAAATPRPDVTPRVCIGSSGEQIGLPIVGRQADVWNGRYRDDADWQRKRGIVDAGKRGLDVAATIGHFELLDQRPPRQQRDAHAVTILQHH